MNRQAQEAEWFQMIVTDKRGLSGTSVVEFVNPIIRRLGASAVVVSDLVGAAPDLRDHEGQVLSVDVFLQKAATATQFDWAFFFLYVGTPSPEEASSSDDKEAVLQADLTIRLADDTYFYIYGSDRELMSELKRRYPEAEFKASKFSDLEIPY